MRGKTEIGVRHRDHPTALIDVDLKPNSYQHSLFCCSILSELLLIIMHIELNIRISFVSTTFSEEL